MLKSGIISGVRIFDEILGTAQKSDAQDKKGYMGGKGQDGVFQTIINEIPPCNDYWELFAGDAAIFRKIKNKPKRCILVEIDHKQAKSLAKSLNVPCHTFDSFLLNVVSYEPIGTFVVWGSAFDILKNLSMEHLDKPDTYIFADPPYMLETRFSNRYKHELTDGQHVTLLNHFRGFKSANIGITTYPNDTYKSVLDQWRKVEYSTVTRNRGAVRIEHFYLNYDDLSQWQDVSYSGKDFREREALKKQQNNWEKNFKKMPRYQQQAIWEKINRQYTS